MKVLVGCEVSGKVREAFRAFGYNAWSCDVDRADDSQQFHIQGDLLDVMHSEPWDLMIAHPPCTYLSVSGLHWNKRRPEREQLTNEAVIFFLRCYEAPIPKVCIENPVGCMSTILRKPDQIIQPYQFGDDASKRTCLWLRGLPRLTIPHRSKWHAGRVVEWPEGSETFITRWSNQTDSGQNRLGPSPTRAKQRSETYPGIALAFAENWGNLI